MVKILNNEIKRHIKDVIANVFPNINKNDLKVLQALNITLINLMAIKFGFEESNIADFYYFLKQNDSQHILSFLKLLLPFIDDANSFALFKEITSLKDISCKRYHKYNDENNPQVNPYMLSTIQYSLSMFENGSLVEYELNRNFLEAMLQNVFETIEISRTKLYVNWLDILPITVKNYKSSKLYKHSFTIKDGEFFVEDPLVNDKLSYVIDSHHLRFDKPSCAFYRGLPLHDMFNSIYVFLYNDIFSSGTKWLLYEQQRQPFEHPVTYLEVLTSIFPLDLIDIPFSDDQSIITKWKALEFESDMFYKKFIKCIILKFDRNYCTDEMCEEYDYDNVSFYKMKREHKINFEDEDEFLELDIDIDSSDFITKKNNFFSKIPLSVIYDFVSLQINKFKKTWYGKNMIDGNKIKNIPDMFGLESLKMTTSNNTYFLTFKNIYNYAKHVSKQSVRHMGIKRYVRFSRNLNNNDFDIFLKVLSGKSDKPFNISNVLKQTYGYKNNETFLFQKFIEDGIMHNLKDLMFHVLINAGLLTELKPNPYFTDKSLLGIDDLSRKIELGKRFKSVYVGTELGEQFLDTEYYLTGKKFKELEIYEDEKLINWFEHLSLGEPWFNYFALSVISQLTFNLKYLNNRVLLVTGSTGQGKSVIVPILFYHASIALDLNLRSKVVSTQALVVATVKNSKFMSKILGVPIELNDLPTFSSYFQFSTQKSRHLVKNTDTFIKEVTDRTLLEELAKNPTLKKKNSKNFYDTDNVYDIVIVDEAHMHFVSMDLILSLMFNTVFINNNIKLVITSATMDADEHIYRRFYKSIDNNLIYPITFNTYRTDTILNRNLVDMRFHISPPGESTRYIVKDIYLPVDTKDYNDAERMGIQTIKNIISKNPVGDFLFFTTDSFRALEISRILNKNTPDNVIALPLYSKLRDGKEEWFKIIESIDSKKHMLEYRKEDIIDVILNGPDGFEKIVPNYSQVIIVATNVVEASITINSLKFVIDTGYAVNVAYDDDKNSNVLAINPISEASRLQRRGRVGRVSDGTVYYMYKKGARSDIKPSYDIVTQDITFDILKLLTTECKELLFDPLKHPQQMFNKLGEEGSKFDFDFFTQEENIEIKIIYLTQYVFSQTFTDKDPNMLREMFSYRNNGVYNPIDFFKPKTQYKDGFGISTLMDYKGHFYVIHPGETLIYRNFLTGEMIDNEVNDKTSIDKVQNIVKKLVQIKYLYFDVNDPFIKTNNHELDKHLKKQSFILLIDEMLLKHSDAFNAISKNFSYEDIVKVLKTMFVGDMLGCLQDVIKVISLAYTMQSHKNIVSSNERNPKIKNFDEYMSKWTDPGSELKAFLKIMKSFETYSRKIVSVDDKIINDKIIERYQTFNEYVNRFGNKLLIDKKLLEQSGLTRIELKNFINSRNKKDIKEKLLSNFKESVPQLVFLTNSLDFQCKKLFLNKSNIESALDLEYKLNKFIANPEIIQYMNTFKDIYLLSYTKYDPLIMSFLENYTYNIIKYNSLSKKFISVTSNVEITKPELTLTSIYESYYFYMYVSDKSLIGLTPISKDMIKKIIGYSDQKEKYRSVYKEELLTTDPLTKTSIKIVDPKNKKYEMKTSNF